MGTARSALPEVLRGSYARARCRNPTLNDISLTCPTASHSAVWQKCQCPGSAAVCRERTSHFFVRGLLLPQGSHVRSAIQPQGKPNSASRLLGSGLRHRRFHCSLDLLPETVPAAGPLIPERRTLLPARRIASNNTTPTTNILIYRNKMAHNWRLST